MSGRPVRWGQPWPSNKCSMYWPNGCLGPCDPYLVFLVIDMLPLIINLDGQLFNPPLQFSVGGLQNCLLPEMVG